MKLPLQRLLVIACALHLSGAHWVLLQTAAWTGMLVTRTQTEGVEKAVKTTFDGEHPCPLCAAIASGQKEQKKNAADTPALKEISEIKLIAVEAARVPASMQTGESQWQEFVAAAPWRTDAPPTPPPFA